MNIFVTSFDVKQCALDHCIVHRNKMIVEYCQLMSTAQKAWGTHKKGMYKPTHFNHPSAIWVRQSEGNYAWLHALCTELCDLFLLYNGYKHKCAELLPLLAIETTEQPVFTRQMLAMPEQYKHSDVKTSYHQYLRAKFKEWQERSKPIRVRFHSTPPIWL